MGGGTTVQAINGPHLNDLDPFPAPAMSSSPRTSPPSLRLRSTKAIPDLRSIVAKGAESARQDHTKEQSRRDVRNRDDGVTMLGKIATVLEAGPVRVYDPATLAATTTEHLMEDAMTGASLSPSSALTERTLRPSSGSSNLSAVERKERKKRRQERLNRPLPPPPTAEMCLNSEEEEEIGDELGSLGIGFGSGSLRRSITNPGPFSSSRTDPGARNLRDDINNTKEVRIRNKYLPRVVYSNLHKLAEHELSRCGDQRILSSADPHLVDIQLPIGIVLSIVQGRRYRDKLEHLINCLDVTNPPKVAEAIAKDEPQLEKLLIKVLKSDSERNAALSLQGHDAELFMDVLQNFELDHHSDRPDLAKDAGKLLVTLSKLSTNLPESMFISGVEPVKERNLHGGTFGDVYRSMYEGKPVALKRLRIFQRSDENEKRALYKKFCREALIWQTLRHEYVLPFLGIDAENFPRQPCMVSPWMTNGTLNYFLKRNPKANIDKLLYEIAQGINYLHSQNIVHGDIKGVNILIDEYWRPHLADFGLTLFADATRQNTTDMGGTLRWMAPELFAGIDEEASKRTSASDMYAYGCLCVEAYTGKPPFQDIRVEIQVIGYVKNGGRPSRPTGSTTVTNELWDLVNACWNERPSQRPTSQTVVEVLRTILRHSAIDTTQSQYTLPKTQSRTSLGGGGRLSIHSNYSLVNSPSSMTGVGEEQHSRPTLSMEDQVELARCLKRIRTHADPGRLYRDTKIIRYDSSIKVSEAAIKGTNTTVAIKQFHASTQDVQTLRRLVDEFHDMRYLHHPNLINYIDLFQHDKDIWVVLEGMKKTVSLKKVISANVSKDAGLKESFIITVLRNVGQAVNYLHRHGIVHGKINSEEVLLSSVGKSNLVRLRLGAMLRDPDVPSSIYLDSCAPEVVDRYQDNDGGSTAVDIWSLGILAIEMFDNTLDSRSKRTHFMERIESIKPPPSSLMLEFLRKTLQVNPSKRPPIGTLLQDSFLHK